MLNSLPFLIRRWVVSAAPLFLLHCGANDPTPPSALELVDPHGKGIFLIGDTLNINLPQNSGILKDTPILLSTDAGAKWKDTLDNLCPASSAEMVCIFIPSSAGTQNRIKIEIGGASFHSPAFPAQEMFFMYPSGGEILQTGDTLHFEWRASPLISSVGAYLYRDSLNGEAIPLVETASVTRDMPEWPGYGWKIPPGISCESCWIEIYDYLDETVSQITPGSFRIRAEAD